MPRHQRRRELLRLWLAFVKELNIYFESRGCAAMDFAAGQKRDEYGQFAEEDGGGSQKDNNNHQAPTAADLAESQSKIKELDNIDFTKEAVLPAFTKYAQKRYGLKDKPIRLKAGIITRNEGRHSDVMPEQARRIIGLSLYKMERVFTNEAKNYLCFVSSVRDDKFTDVVLDMEETLKEYEIVHYHWLNDKALISNIKSYKKRLLGRPC